MAFASVGTLGTGGVDAGAGNCVITTGATAESGNLVILGLAKDNVNTGGGTTSEITSVSDSASNAYTSAYRKANTAVASASAYVEGFFKRLTSQLNSGGTITIVKTTDVDCVATAWEFTCSTAVQVAGVPQVAENDGTSVPNTMTISGLSSKEYLFVRLTAAEAEDATNWTPSAGWTALTPQFSSTLGSADTNQVIRGEFRILTGTGATSAPGNLPGSADHASIMFALEEAGAGGAGGLLPKMQSMGLFVGAGL